MLAVATLREHGAVRALSKLGVDCEEALRLCTFCSQLSPNELAFVLDHLTQDIQRPGLDAVHHEEAEKALAQSFARMWKRGSRDAVVAEFASPSAPWCSEDIVRHMVADLERREAIDLVVTVLHTRPEPWDTESADRLIDYFLGLSESPGETSP